MAFNILPIEINEHIASYLMLDSDLSSFTLTCHEARAAVNSSRSGIWRQRFARSFDLPPRKLSYELKTKYQLRQKTLRRPVRFQYGQDFVERRALELVRDLIVESFVNAGISQDVTSELISNNVAQLRRFVLTTDLLSNIFFVQSRPGITDPLMETIQLLFTHWTLELPSCRRTYGFPTSQQVVYSHPNTCPMFLDSHMRKVNIEYLLHVANFFKYHLTLPEEATLYHLFQELEDDEKPRGWQGRLEQGPKKLGSHWKGSYSYLHDINDIQHIRSEEPGSNIFTDSIDYNDGFQTLNIDFSSLSSTPWPRAFEKHLHSLPLPELVGTLKYGVNFNHQNHRDHTQELISLNRQRSKYLPSPPSTPPFSPAPPSSLTPPSSLASPGSIPPSPSTYSFEKIPKPRKGRDYLPFIGTGNDAEAFHCAGNVHALPPQHGIPGWQRITLMKHFQPLSAASSSDSSELVDMDIGNGCWAYEGIVLPGGMMMLGRWWSPLDDSEERACTGPFIFWNVPAV
ncbi:hypothetical protein MMC12_000332 [Toensbergia leucococca]|nr:hypothetical protein [Toensbergia leucococca]